MLTFNLINSIALFFCQRTLNSIKIHVGKSEKDQHFFGQLHLVTITLLTLKVLTFFGR